MLAGKGGSDEEVVVVVCGVGGKGCATGPQLETRLLLPHLLAPRLAGRGLTVHLLPGLLTIPWPRRPWPWLDGRCLSAGTGLRAELRTGLFLVGRGLTIRPCVPVKRGVGLWVELSPTSDTLLPLDDEDSRQGFRWSGRTHTWLIVRLPSAGSKYSSAGAIPCHGSRGCSGASHLSLYLDRNDISSSCGFSGSGTGGGITGATTTW